MRRRRGSRGFTLAEMMITVVIMGIVAGMSAKAFTATWQFFRMSMARAELQRDARQVLDMLNRSMRQARASTVVVTSDSSSQPPYSKVTFDTLAVSSVSFWQDGRKLMMQEGAGGSRVLADDLRYLAFTYGQTDNATIMSVSVSFEKSLYSGRKKALQMAVDKVRLMNN